MSVLDDTHCLPVVEYMLRFSAGSCCACVMCSVVAQACWSPLPYSVIHSASALKYAFWFGAISGELLWCMMLHVWFILHMISTCYNFIPCLIRAYTQVTLFNVCGVHVAITCAYWYYYQSINPI
jgi:hypothetical protein